MSFTYHKKMEKYLLKRSQLENLMQSGGAALAFKNTQKFYLLAQIGDSRNNQQAYGLNARFTDRYRAAFNVAPQRNFHFTLLEFDINKDTFGQWLSGFITNSGIEKQLASQAKQYLDALQLHSNKGEYEAMGSAVAKVYSPHPQQQSLITDFRKAFYKQLLMSYKITTGHDIGFGQVRQVIDKKTNIGLNYNFFVDKQTGQELYAVSERYFGVGVWKPHISIGYTSLLPNADANMIHQAFSQTAIIGKNPVSDILFSRDIDAIDISLTIGPNQYLKKTGNL